MGEMSEGGRDKETTGCVCVRASVPVTAICPCLVDIGV